MQKELISLIKEAKRVLDVHGLKDWNFQSAIEWAEAVISKSPEERDSTFVQYSEADLIRFGNFLLKTYGVMVHSNDGKNQPIYERGVTHADMCNWKDVNKPIMDGPYYSHGDKVKVFLMPEGEDQFPGLNARILTVHHHVGKTKYDLEIRFAGDFSTRIYNVDEAIISSVK